LLLLFRSREFRRYWFETGTPSFLIKLLEQRQQLTPEGRALQQIKDKGYADKYLARGEPIHLIGVEFSKAERNIVGFEFETL
jgi:cobalamin biosynthesis Co2+ chelatase CbiK